ncbi:unnamed protein product [Bursaphelenchus okinawaensis]|uniref:Uncharacterized protein n=1 Tax=Bursaphelenchus okinawaensis TaxID=465554 RepID=A0A811JTX6_9BILA|nr:unnamed protein product [Bursaphelenchus okinawaensis]CAG9083639.1 unnamed protein product [Bursaphelenchus okinawaensis]
MRLWLLVAAITNVELLKAADNIEYAWCDTIECLLLFAPATRFYAGLEENKFIYIPSEALYNAWGNSSIETFADNTYSKLASNRMYKKSFAPLVKNFTLTYTYIPSLGRFQDVIKPRDEKFSVKQIMDVLMARRISTIYEYDINKKSTCRDKYGYYSNTVDGSETCMSLMSFPPTNFTFQYYAGPVTWNRIRFDDKDYLLRLLLTNNEFSAAHVPDNTNPSMEKYMSCQHTNGAVKPPDNVCYAVFGLFSYSRICCCYNKKCDILQPLTKTLQKYQVCPYGHFDIHEQRPIIRKYEYEEFGAKSIAKLCYLVYNITVIEGKKNEGHVALKASLGGTNDTGEAWYYGAVSDHICRRNITRCLDINTEDVATKRMLLTCYCQDPAQCYNLTLSSFNDFNQFYGRALNKKEQFCKRLSFNFARDIKLKECHTYVDLAYEKPVLLVFLNNMVTYNLVFEFRLNSLEKYDPRLEGKAVTVRLMNGYIMDTVLKDCNNTVYPPKSIADREVRLWYQFRCSFARCDEIFDNKGVAILKDYPDLYPQCLALSKYIYKLKHGDVDRDFEDFFGQLIWGVDVSKSYCVIQYTSPLRKDGSEDFAFITGTVTADDYKNFIRCPNYNRKDSVICVRNKMKIFTYCCRPYFTYESDEEKYRRALRNFIQEDWKLYFLPHSQIKVEKSVNEPGDCLMNRNGLTTNELCEFEPGCYGEFMFSLFKNLKSAGCAQSGVATTMASKDIYRHHIHAGSLCDIKQNYRTRRAIYEGECVVVNNGVQSVDDVPAFWMEDTANQQRLRARKLLCCCEDAVDCHHDLISYVAYYDYYLDENQEKLDEILKTYNLDDIDPWKYRP